MKNFWIKRVGWAVAICSLIALVESTELELAYAGTNEYSQSCPSMGAYNVEKFVEESKKSRTLIENLFKQLPKDVRVAHEQHEYIASRAIATVYFAPSISATPFFGMRPPFEFRSPCGVYDINDVYWIVYIAEDGTVGYVQPKEINVAK